VNLSLANFGSLELIEPAPIARFFSAQNARYFKILGVFKIQDPWISGNLRHACNQPFKVLATTSNLPGMHSKNKHNIHALQAGPQACSVKV
jgi:hypothetical protein